MKNGTVVINLPEHFRLVTNENGLTVQVTPTTETKGLYVVNKSTKQITIKEIGNGKSNAGFDYLVNGVRLGYEDRPVIVDKYIDPQPVESDVLEAINIDEYREKLRKEIKAERKELRDQLDTLNEQDKSNNALDQQADESDSILDQQQVQQDSQAGLELRWWQKIGNFFKGVFKR